MKKLSDVIHLYIGQEYDGICDDKPRKITHSNIETIMSSKLGVPKPILRPLSDMKREEADVLRCIWPYPVELEIKGLMRSPEQFMYALKQGFDLFQLIPSGQAIDKTKMG